MGIEDAPKNYSDGMQSEWDKLSDPIEVLRDTAVDMTNCKDGELTDDFPGGVYLYHGARIEQVKKILESGAIMNAGAVYEAKLEERRRELLAEGKNDEEIEAELKKVYISQNSGQEGVSWSANRIDALPGTRGHIAGFVASPEKVLGDDKLVVPSRPAPYELLQLSNDVDSEKFFETKKQHEVWGYRNISLGEMATVESGLMFMILAKKNENDEFGFKSLMKEYAERGGVSAEELRKHYEVNGDQIRIDTELHQQRYNEKYLPPAAVWMQYMIDSGMFKNTSVDGLDVNDLVKMSFEKENLVEYVLSKAREQSKRYADEYDAELERAKNVVVPVEDMYLVTSHNDLGYWLGVIKDSGHKPRGILLYDDEKVVKENFAQADPGDHEELSDEIGRVVGVDNGFWSERMGINVEAVPRAGSHGQVLAENPVNLHNNEIHIENGEITVKSL